MTMDWSKNGAEVITGPLAQSGSGLPPKKVAAESSFQTIALELENLRLTRLVAELLMKNQQLRERLALTPEMA